MKYSKELAQQIADLIEQGNYAKVAANACGITEETFLNWQRPVNTDRSVNAQFHSEFSELIKKAEAKRVTTLISFIRKDLSWQSKAWILERTNRDLYSPQSEKIIIERIDKLEELLLEVKDVKRS